MYLAEKKNAWKANRIQKKRKSSKLPRKFKMDIALEENTERDLQMLHGKFQMPLRLAQLVRALCR